ncbi:alpha/beta hydrolase [Mycobacterium colombiense]|uniref:alpha/beta hydrolase n=1 Tax=Mycobacterium colombiense TaxID=339268 RepID=UPI00200B0B8A|nr:alpha/beta hydrolase [Mycobacterium colombiense]MCK8642386.1 alpha/beta hydrolase [Mycobacterium colombiense]
MTRRVSRKFDRRTVDFLSGDSYCTAWLYLPDAAADAPVPIVVMGHGLGATRELGLAPYAERFAAAGLAVLAFTYRHLGDSGGAPRQLLSMTKQLADWDAAIEYASGLPEVDSTRIAIWGSSLGGGHAIEVAARHPELRAAVSQCPFTDGFGSAGALGIRESLVLTGLAARDLAAAALRKDPVCIPVAAAPGQVGMMTAPDALPGMLAIVPDGHRWVNKAAARSVLNVIRYRPGRAAKHISAPILFCVSTTDSVAPPAQATRYAHQAPRSDVRLYDAGHFEFYVGDAFKQLVADQTEFLVEHLQPAGVRRNASGLTVAEGS